MELTQALAGNIVKTRYEDLPQEAREATKKSIFDTLAVMFPPTTSEKACASLADIVKESGGREESSLVGFGGKAPCLMAAFLNGSLTHPMDYDDALDEPGYHPTANTFPAALALAEKMRNVSGKDFIAAVTLGNDIGIRLASAPKGRLLDDYPWFPMTHFGMFSATVAAGKLLRLPEDEMINALGVALHCVSGITEAITAPDSEMRAIRDGFTNKDGLLSALMAGKGIRACKDALERFFKVFYRNEYDPQALVLNLGKKFRGVEASLKPWPCCRETHGYIQAALEIVKERSMESDQIREVMLTVGSFNREYLCEPTEVKRNPKLSIDAKFSLPFTIGVALAKKRVQIAHFFPENLKDPEILEMAKRINYRFDPEFGPITPAVVEINTKDGKSFSKRVEIIYGHPKNPLSEKDLIAKFRDCVRYAKKPLAPERIEQLIGKLFKLEEAKDVREITSLLDGGTADL